MPSRWIRCPIVLVDGQRMPLAATLEEPGTSPFAVPDEGGGTNILRSTYRFAMAVDLGTTCLGVVTGNDLSALNTDGRIQNLLGRDRRPTEENAGDRTTLQALGILQPERIRTTDGTTRQR